ncbi:hypothetical protein JW933_03070 [candidate division FCPU426 bacterium]|nr:hypothetical protein [candidate division FCPU426 bacterium]
MKQVLKKRPLGIIVLSLFHMVSGLFVLLIACLTWVFLDKINIFFSLLVTPAERFITSGLIACLVLVISGVLMWRGDTWGYYLGSFHYLAGALQNINTLLMLPFFLSSVYPNVEPVILITPQLFFAFYGLQGLLQALIYLYFFKRSVRVYFRVEEQNHWRFLIIQLIICLGIIILGLLYAIIM